MCKALFYRHLTNQGYVVFHISQKQPTSTPIQIPTHVLAIWSIHIGEYEHCCSTNLDIFVWLKI